MCSDLAAEPDPKRSEFTSLDHRSSLPSSPLHVHLYGNAHIGAHTSAVMFTFICSGGAAARSRPSATQERACTVARSCPLRFPYCARHHCVRRHGGQRGKREQRVSQTQHPGTLTLSWLSAPPSVLFFLPFAHTLSRPSFRRVRRVCVHVHRHSGSEFLETR